MRAPGRQRDAPCYDARMVAADSDASTIDSTGPRNHALPDAALYLPVQRHATTLWGSQPDITVVAPGRIEIVGNHVDYNGGEVITAAIDRWVAVVAQRRANGLLQATALDMASETRAEPLDLVTNFDRRAMPIAPGWFDFPRAAIAATAAAGISLPGVAFSYRGTIPPGVGLASSAALLVALVTAIARLAEVTLTRFEVATIAQQAEHRLGAPVGMLDQIASVTGGLLRFSNRSERVRGLPSHLGDTVFAVIDSGIRHALSASRYPARVAECHEALDILQRAGCGIGNLASLPATELEPALALLPAPLDRRVRHIVGEVERVRLAETAIEAGDSVALGRLMDTSGHSSATLYEISHPAVETIVETARAVPGVYGARMMGGGDGGAALVLVERNAMPALQRAMGDRAPIVCRIAQGSTIIG